VLLTLLLALAFAAPSQALRKASHKGWPTINGMLLLNKFDQSRPLDARPGQDPFQGTDPAYRCDGDHQYQGCFIKAGACPADDRHTSMCEQAPIMPVTLLRHHELLGGHGNDRIYGGNGGDVIWGDYKPSGQPLTQHDRIYGGTGNDFIYASHGFNFIHTGGGRDIVHARYGSGDIYCDSSMTIVNLSKRSQRRYHLHGCPIVTLRAVGTEPA
jgi:Ca2+-binding RTX toxin-like protein